jgi:aspartyl-tRNA(Asn)/glutamyl-tRNA(Gln) amidotransferase subunit B
LEYETAIGLEVHVELKTKSKIFCGCSTVFGGDPNTQCCPVCSGMPGSLPVLNRKAVEYAVKAGLATNCSISGHSVLDRKNYFYPDLPKAYQISQLYKPLCINGYIGIETGSITKKIRIREIHLEEDAGKLIHDEYGRDTFIDFNRCGVPLIEIVTEPDLRSSEDAKTFLGILKAILVYTDVSDCRMQEGSLRADVNLSVREKGCSRLGVKTEMKNLNSFKAIVRAIDSEAERQIMTLEKGGKIVQETRRWDDIKGMSSVMRKLMITGIFRNRIFIR